MKTNNFSRMIVLTVSALVVASAQGGAYFDAGIRPAKGKSPYPGEVLYEMSVGRWADNCIPVHYSLNITMDPILDPAGQPAMTLAEARVALESALESFREIRASYIDARLDGEIANMGEAGFDFVNEITFHSDHLDYGPTVSGLSWATFQPVDYESPPGVDFDADGDGDVDVMASIKTCRDVDGDGDIELPAGKFPAGTIVDNDIYFFPHTNRYADLAKDPLSILDYDPRTDLEGVAAHEFGHGFGLQHSIVADADREDGSGATMYPLGTTDGGLSLRTLHSDDIASIAYLYPEGSKKSGPGALQRGDVAFDKEYVLISGEVRDGSGKPVAGAQPYAVDHRGAIVTNAVSGKFYLSIHPDTPDQFRPVPAHARYVLPVPRGLYRIGLESADGYSVPHGHTNLTEQWGAETELLDFPEEYWSGPFENSKETHASIAWPLLALHDRDGIDFRTNDSQQLLAVAGANPAGDKIIELAAAGTVFAARIPTAQLLAVDEGRGISIQAGLFGLTPLFEEEAVFLKNAMITTGKVLPDGSAEIDMQNPLASETEFLLHTLELNSLHVANPAQLGDYVRRKLAGTGRDLFLVAVYPDEEHAALPGYGVSPVASVRKAPTLEEPRVGNSFFSPDGGVTFGSKFSDLYFGLVVTAR